MKKQYSLIISAVMIISLLLSACSMTEISKASEPLASSSATEKTTSVPVSSNSTQSPHTTAAEKQTEPPATTELPGTEPVGREYTIADVVLVDNEFCSFKIVKAENDKIWGLTLKVLCENKTADKKLMFSVDDAVVNGYAVSTLFAQTVAAGKKANDDITFSSSDMMEIGLTTADEITFALRIHDYDDWTASDYVKETFTIYPTGMTADQIVIPERKTTEEEQIIADNEYCTFIILSAEEDKIWGYTLKCYIENKTDTEIICSWNDTSINGFMIDPLWAKSLTSGMRCYSDIHFSKSRFEENGITVVEEIDFMLRIHDNNDWMRDDFIKEKFTYKP